MVFPVVMYRCESWTIKKAECQKNWCFWTVVLETLESPLDSKEIQLVHPKGDQSWIFIGRTDTEAEAPILRMRWPKYWSFSFSISPSKEHPGLISFRMDWLDLLAVQGTLRSLLQHHSSKASILWPSDAKGWLIGKDSEAGKDWRQEEKGTTEDEMVGWHHWLDGHEFEQAPGVVDG